MKLSSIIAMGTVALLTLTATAPRTVIAPQFTSAPLTFRIGAVHLSDTATRVDVDIYQRPRYWVTADTNVYLESQLTDNEYHVRRIEGIPLREHVYGGDSAHIRATYVFDPLEPEDSVFDFVERGGSWVVRGIDINGKPEGFVTHISGTVKNRPTASWLLLVPRGEDFRVSRTIIVPVENGRFDYDLYTTDTLAYELVVGFEVLGGSWSVYKFMTEGEPVTVNIDNTDTPAWIAVEGGGPMTRRLLDSSEMIQRIYDESGVFDEGRRLNSQQLYYTPRVYEIWSELEENGIDPDRRDSLLSEYSALRSAGRHVSDIGKIMEAKEDSVVNLGRDAIIRFIETDRSIAGLSLIYEKMIFSDPDFDRAIEVFSNVYADRFPHHPYTVALKQQMTDESAKLGKRFPDFSAPDLNGDVHTLSDLIKGKYAVIDLWASWCGPCRKHSMELIPVYEKWKDKGFTVVGVARENGDTRAMEHCIEQDGYPWLNLVELNDAGNIWMKYMAANVGGKMVMVSPGGVVIAVDPSASEVDALLSRLISE